MKFLSRAAGFSIFFCLFLVFASSANCQPVVVNEIAWMGNKTSANDEWIELYNNTGAQIDLSGWKLTSQDGTPEINLTGNIPAFGFYLLERTNDDTVPNVPVDQIYTGALLNSGENLILYHSAGNVVEAINCSGGWFSGSNETKQTMERIAPEKNGIDPANWATSKNPEGTPKAKNSVAVETPQASQEPIQPETEVPLPQDEPLPQEQPQQEPPQIEAEILTYIQPQIIPFPAGVIINEILPSPDGPDQEEEWIEIFNQNQFEVDLAGWQLKDSAGVLTTFVIPSETKIQAFGFLVFKRPTTKIVLNNDGDEINLVQPDGKILETVSYPKASKNVSYSRMDSDWFWTAQLTPGAKNIIPESASQSDKTAASESLAEKQETLSFKKGLSAIGEQVTKNNFIIPLIAVVVAIFSAVIILILKTKIKNLKKS